MHIQILISKEINCRGNRRFGCVTKITNVTHSLRDFLPSEKKTPGLFVYHHEEVYDKRMSCGKRHSCATTGR